MPCLRSMSTTRLRSDAAKAPARVMREEICGGKRL